MPGAAKLSITVDSDVLREVRRRAKRAKRSVSAEITEALARDVRRRRLESIVAEHEVRRGRIEDEELRKIRDTWPG